ncbi:hypothetical protein QYM36_018427 [Artemia franciscana]|uniref:Uncharacterized protein n=1 Tax=Artemia franciscana TaxID=6661 RepID=A0AA88KUR9_ARTSF|nr:hypothetical protein QYM36_018427 [Artemia franciscana]
MMNDTAALLSSMLPPYADALGLYDPNAGVPHHHHPPKPALMYRVPRVVADQKSKFESDELFRRLGRESETRYVGFRDRPIEERQARFINGCKEGHTEIAVVATGTNFQLVFSPLSIGYSSSENLDTCDFSKEPGKVIAIIDVQRFGFLKCPPFYLSSPFFSLPFILPSSLPVFSL